MANDITEAQAEIRRRLENQRAARATQHQSTQFLSKVQGNTDRAPALLPEDLRNGVTRRLPAISLTRVQLLQLLSFAGSDRFSVTIAETLSDDGKSGIAAFFTDHPGQGAQDLLDEPDPIVCAQKEVLMEGELLEMFEMSIAKRERDANNLAHDLSLSTEAEWDKETAT